MDAELFAPERVPVLREALADYAWLLDRGYSADASLKLVGDRFQLRERARVAVWRAVATPAQVAGRAARRVDEAAVAGAEVWLDGYNVLISVEAWLSGGFVFVGLDGCVRDLASVHGTYRRVEETDAAIACISDWLTELRARRVVWLLDAPVSNSGRLAARLRDAAAQAGRSQEVRVVPDPDRELAAGPGIVVTGDGEILDAPVRWLDLLSPRLVERHDPPRRIDLRGGSGDVRDGSS